MTAPVTLTPELQALMHDAYCAGFVAASRWASRKDLIADTDSPAYMKERDLWLQKRLKHQEMAGGDSSACGREPTQ